jgi:hypothetical protein
MATARTESGCIKYLSQRGPSEEGSLGEMEVLVHPTL